MEKLIDHAFADGEVTDKERQVIYKKAYQLGVDRDEVDVVIEAREHQIGEVALKKRQEGKCPQCGDTISGLSKVCGSCGYVVDSSNAKASDSLLKTEMDRLEESVFEIKTAKQPSYFKGAIIFFLSFFTLGLFYVYYSLIHKRFFSDTEKNEKELKEAIKKGSLAEKNLLRTFGSNRDIREKVEEAAAERNEVSRKLRIRKWTAKFSSVAIVLAFFIVVKMSNSGGPSGLSDTDEGKLEQEMEMAIDEGKFERAFEIAGKLQLAEHDLVDIRILQAAHAFGKGDSKTVNEALTHPENDGWSKTSGFSKAFNIESDSGFEKSKQMVSLLNDDKARKEYMHLVKEIRVQGLANQQEYEQAREIVRTIKDIRTAQSLENIITENQAQRLIEQKRYEDAIQKALAMHDVGFDRKLILDDIFAAQAKEFLILGKFQEAQNAARRMDDGWEKDELLAEINSKSPASINTSD
ncbi:hypothetical protein [Marinobacter segnicrescens]|uniref:hypothetical protein n=1 Tax=Marinobacter segnicrescens TaxID=430453 RepID=UPI003A9026AD